MTETAAEHEQGLAGQTKAELVELSRSDGEVRGLSKLNKSQLINRLTKVLNPALTNPELAQQLDRTVENIRHF